MGGRGPAPKDPAKRRRRNTDTKPDTLAPDGKLRGPELPADVDWPERTRTWWDTWRRSAMAQTLTGTDWDFLLDTALLHAQLWSGGSGTEKAAAELRLRVAKFGATPEDRARLRLAVTDPPPAPPGEQPAAAGEKGRYGHLRSVSPE